MPRARLTIGIALAFALLGAGAADPHPGHPQPMVTIAKYAYAPQTITAYTGDTVLWTWAGPDTNHSVTSDASSPQQFDSDPGKSALQIDHPVNDGFSVTFNKAGTYTYHCKVHNFTGTVVVKQSPPVVPAAPALTSVKAKMHGRTAGVTLTVSQKADVQLLVVKRGKKHTLHEVDANVPQGTSTRKVKFGKLKAGAYDIRIIAVNPVTGLSSKTVVVHVRLAP